MAKGLPKYYFAIGDSYILCSDLPILLSLKSNLGDILQPWGTTRLTNLLHYFRGFNEVTKVKKCQENITVEEYMDDETHQTRPGLFYLAWVEWDSKRQNSSQTSKDQKATVWPILNVALQYSLLENGFPSHTYMISRVDSCVTSCCGTAFWMKLHWSFS